MSTKARDFWIFNGVFSEVKFSDSAIHVIEYSAYEELKKETAKLKRTNERLAMRYKELKEQLSRQNEIMAETLKLIASPSEFNCAVGEGNMRAAANAALAKCGKITNKRLRRDGMILYLKTAILVNDKDSNRCAHGCQHLEKIKGLYTCKLYDSIVDTGDDDDIGYGFQRKKQCLDNVIGHPHIGNFAGDL